MTYMQYVKITVWGQNVASVQDHTRTDADLQRMRTRGNYFFYKITRRKLKRRNIAFFIKTYSPYCSLWRMR